MAFTDETTVREHSQLKDTNQVPSALITQRITDAHNDILRDLLTEYQESDDPVLKLGETELATAYVLRSLAFRAAALAKNIRLPDISYRETSKVDFLLKAAGEEEARAWAHLAPYCKINSKEGFNFSLIEPVEPQDPDFDPNNR